MLVMRGIASLGIGSVWRDRVHEAGRCNMADITDITNIQREGQEAAEAAAVIPPQPPVKLRLVVFEEPQGTPAAAMGRGGDDKSPATAIGDRLDLRGGGLLTAVLAGAALVATGLVATGLVAAGLVATGLVAAGLVTAGLV